MYKNVLLFLSQGVEEPEASCFRDVLGWSRAFGKEPVISQARKNNCVHRSGCRFQASGNLNQ